MDEDDGIGPALGDSDLGQGAELGGDAGVEGGNVVFAQVAWNTEVGEAEASVHGGDIGAHGRAISRGAAEREEGTKDECGRSHGGVAWVDDTPIKGLV
jgi:hypothetical protein